jgi:hypothetical protein
MTLHLSPIRNPARTLLILGVTAAAGLSLLAAWSASSGPKVPFDARCEAWDVAATAAVAELIADRSPAVDQRLGDVVFRLRRARTYCRHGFVSLAQLDYRALTDGRYAGYRLSGESRTAAQTSGR